MATARDLDFIYTTIDRLFRLSIGEMADFSGAMYDGNFALSLEEAQRRKHAFIARELRIGAGTRVLDLGCGWGPFLAFARAAGASGTGVTLSQGQALACQRNGLDVHVMDCRTVTRETFGGFDAVVSLGAFEHFCSRKEFAAGRQDAIYADLFQSVRGLLPPGGRFFLQTMVFGRNMIPPEQIGLDQIIRAATPGFRMVSSSSGRLDYLETIRQWRRRFAAFSWPKLAVKLTLVPRYLTSRDFRNAFASGISANSICFERELLDHYRIVFEAV
jgi:cyclopropane-fatty-acyl-phospholipid synthase